MLLNGGEARQEEQQTGLSPSLSLLWFFVQVVAATESLSAALAAIAQLAAHESTSSLQLLADQRTKLMGLAEVGVGC